MMAIIIFAVCKISYGSYMYVFIDEILFSTHCSFFFRLPHETSQTIMNYQGQYGIPADYNQADYPPVKLRNSKYAYTIHYTISKETFSNVNIAENFFLIKTGQILCKLLEIKSVLFSTFG